MEGKGGMACYRISTMFRGTGGTVWNGRPGMGLHFGWLSWD